jgi:hypothetical protein
MMKYAIIRMQKLKSAVGVRRSLKHAFREQETPNVDIQLEAENTHLGASSSAEAIKKFNAALPDKVRSNAVLCVEFLVTASPEKMKEMTRQEQDKYFAEALEFIKDKHGAENVFYSGIHRDESTPHLYAYVVPKKDGKLNCRAFYGEKDALTKMQDDFAEKVAAKNDLNRGIKGSKARHVRIKQFYTDLNRSKPKMPNPDNLSLPESKLLESKADYAKRAVNVYAKEVNQRYMQLYAEASLVETNKKIAEEAKQTAKALEKELEKTRKSFEALKTNYNAQNDGLVAMLSKSDEAAGMQFVKMKRDFEAKQKQKAIERAEEEKKQQLKPKPKGPRL